MEPDNFDEAQLQVKFFTRHEDYAIPDVPFSIPVNLDPTALNNLINELIKENFVGYTKPIEFDFLVFGNILKIPLIELVQEKSISTETTIEIEYVERIPAPIPEDALLHDDWVAGIQAADNWVLTGCYDNTINIWTTKGKHVASANHHTSCVRGVSWLRRGDATKGFVSVSHDLTGLLWHWDVSTNEPQPTVVLKGHERGIDTVAVNGDASRVVTGGWDTYLKIWDASLEQESEEPPNKRNRGLFVRTPIHTLKGHKEVISGASWSDSSTVCTCSMDHTIKFWDIDLCGIKSEIVGQKAFLSLSYSPLSKTIIASSADRHIRLYDPRSADGSVCNTTFTSHTLWVPTVTWSKENEFLFISGSYDKCVKLWDTRSPSAPVYDLSGHQDKVLCVDWSNSKHILSGGADNNVHIFKYVAKE